MSKFSQQTDAADAEDLFLHNSRFGIAAIQMAGDEPVDVAIFGTICIKQIQRNSPDAGEPRLSDNLAPANVYRYGHAVAIRIKNGCKS